MNKITFTNGSAPAISAEILNALQDNIENAINVKFETGTETATNEYIDNKQIYVKRINCGQLPAAGHEKQVPTGLLNVTYLKIDGGFMPDDNQFVPINLTFDTNNLNISTFIQNDNVRIQVKSLGNRTGTIYVNIYYTKNS